MMKEARKQTVFAQGEELIGRSKVQYCQEIRKKFV
jgi:hypothetical protein